MIKSKPRVIPNNRANVILISGKIANKLTTIQNTDHKRTVANEFFPLKYLVINHIIAIIEIIGNIEELKHQDYHGKSIKVRITDNEGTSVESKIDIGVHKHLELEQEEYCFDVCMDDEGASLLKNSREQSVVEKLRALLIFGVNDKRYKDIYDVYYLKDYLNKEKFLQYIKLLIFDDAMMRENTMVDIVRRVENSFKDKHYLKLISTSRQRWFDDEIEVIAKGIVDFLKDL